MVSAQPKTGEAHGSRGRAADIRRARILDAMVLTVCERGFVGVTVGVVRARAKVSRDTFFELFDGLEDCFLTVLDDAYRHARDLIAGAFAREDFWLDGVRLALAELLGFLDRDRALAHVLLVEAAAAGPWARERRERHIAALTALIEDSCGAPREGHPHPLVPAGVMAALLAALHTHLVTGREEPLVALLGALMGLVTAPYLDQPGVAREIERAEAVARELCARGAGSEASAGDDEPVLPALLSNPRAHRARGCLLYLAEHPGASNRKIAQAVGIARHSHISVLLARLAGMGLLLKRPPLRPGGVNAWSLTSAGAEVARALVNPRVSTASREHSSARASVQTRPRLAR